MEVTLSGDKLGFILKLGLYLFLAFIALFMFLNILHQVGAGILITATLSTFAAAAIANAISIRTFERGYLPDIGMRWTNGSGRNLLIGMAAGAGAGMIGLMVPVIFGAAQFQRSATPFNIVNFAFVTFTLFFGAVGEEMLFRGYGFQILLPKLGRLATILPVSMLFGLAHANNPNATALTILNTAGFAIVLSYAFLRSGDLWLPIGLHFGWNWILPSLGDNVSGFTMTTTGLILHWNVSDVWSGGSYGIEGSALAIGIILGLLLVLWKAPIWHHEAFLLQEGSRNGEDV